MQKKKKYEYLPSPMFQISSKFGFTKIHLFSFLPSPHLINCTNKGQTKHLFQVCKFLK